MLGSVAYEIGNVLPDGPDECSSVHIDYMRTGLIEAGFDSGSQGLSRHCCLFSTLR